MNHYDHTITFNSKQTLPLIKPTSQHHERVLAKRSPASSFWASHQRHYGQGVLIRKALTCPENIGQVPCAKQSCSSNKAIFVFLSQAYRTPGITCSKFAQVNQSRSVHKGEASVNHHLRCHMRGNSNLRADQVQLGPGFVIREKTFFFFPGGSDGCVYAK